jgi:glycosyltransferase involved in cell wall biosynthesis
MRVLFVHPAYPNQFTQIAHKMGQQDGIECSFLVDLACSEQIQADGTPITYYGYRRDGDLANPGYSYTSNYEDAIRHGKGVIDVLASLVQSYPIDVVVGHASFGTTFFIKELLNLPVISYVELPGYYMTYCREEFPTIDEHRFLDVSFKSLVYTSVIHSDLAIVPSQHAKEFFPPELQSKIRVQMEGFQTHPLRYDKQALKKRLGLPHDGPIVGFAGRTLEAIRGFDIFVKVAIRLRATRPDLHFLVIGDEETIYGNEQAYLEGKSFKQYVLETEGLSDSFFIFRGFLPYDDFIEHLQAMDIILFPLFEGAANWSLFEAMASGLTILASNCSFIPEVITSDKEGYLFDPYDIDGFTGKALKLLSQPETYSYLGENARKKIINDYSIENAMAGYLAIIKEVTQKRLNPQK